jgi:hypothetical protein
VIEQILTPRFRRTLIPWSKNGKEVNDANQEEYWQRQREEFWQWVYVRSFETAHTCPDITLSSFSRYSDNYAHDEAFGAAEKALQDLDLSRKAGQLSRRYYFPERV